MGERHARVYAQLPACTLVGVYDPDLARAAAVAEQYGGSVFSSMDGLLQHVDAISIVAPTVTHAAIATRALDGGLHMLIEKPMTASLAEAIALTQRVSAAPGSVVMVGHIERFNPVIRELRRHLLGAKVRRVRVRRVAPFDNRCLDTDVVYDLMIHDIDLVQHLFGSQLASLDARGSSIVTTSIDQAIVDITLHGGPKVTMIASRAAEKRVREIEVVLDGAYVIADLLERTISVTSSADHSGRCVTESRPVPSVEPLRAELQHFLSCIAGREQPAVDAQAGLRALEWAAEIESLISRHGAVTTAVDVQTGVAAS
jgi:predicted dehydrogenase